MVIELGLCIEKNTNWRTHVYSLAYVWNINGKQGIKNINTSWHFFKLLFSMKRFPFQQCFSPLSLLYELNHLYIDNLHRHHKLKCI